MSDASVGRVVALFALVAGHHSLLASRQAKQLASRLFGQRRRNGLYRVAFILQSLALTLWAMRRFNQLPDREIYRVGPPWSWLLRAGQLGSVGLFFGTGWWVGPTRISGLGPLVGYLRGRDEGPEPEAQGPRLGPDGELEVVGAFRYTRHPDNLPILGLFWCFPRMTVNRAALAVLATIYAVVGSLHEDYRLRAAYGEAHRRYQRATPFFWPRRPGPAGERSAGTGRPARG